MAQRSSGVVDESSVPAVTIQRAGVGEQRIAEGQLDPQSTQGISVDENRLAVWFEFDSTALRRDDEINSVAGFALVQAAVLNHALTAGDAQHITVHGYASEEGDAQHNLELSRQRAEAVRELLIQARIPAEHIAIQPHGADNSLPALESNRRVEVELSPRVTRIDMPAVASTGSRCVCNPQGQGDIAQWAIDYVTAIAPTIEGVAQRRNVPPLALAGAIAEEYDSRRGPHSFVDWWQDTVLPLYPEWTIDFQRIPDFHNKAQNLLEHDISNANIHVRTALEQVEAGRLVVPRSPPSDAQVSLIVDFLMTERGMVEASGAVIEQGQSLFGPYIGSYDAGYQDAVLIDFFNIGYDNYYVVNFLPKLAANPLHTPCPDPIGDGCQVLHARERLEAAYETGLTP